MCVCVYREVGEQKTRGVRDVGRGRSHDGAGGCRAGDCATVGDGVAAYYNGDYGDEAFGGGDYGVARNVDERYYDDGGGVDSSECEKRESGSGVCWGREDYGPSGDEVAGERPGVPDV